MKNIFICILIIFIAIGCEKKESTLLFKTIDLSIKTKYELNSFKIYNNGNATVLICPLNENARLYKISYSKEELNYIENIISKISLKNCDSINNKLSMVHSIYLF